MKLNKEELKALQASLEQIKSSLVDSLSQNVEDPQQEKKNNFNKVMVQTYLSESGLLDLLIDYDIGQLASSCSCASPCQATCVEPCASADYSQGGPCPCAAKCQVDCTAPCTGVCYFGVAKNSKNYL